MAPTYWLSTHLGYACRHSGACCTAGWPIPIERPRAAAVQREIDQGRVPAPLEWHRPVPDAVPEVAGVLALQDSGACVFHRPRPEGGCAIHSTRPAACEHFPYVCVVDPRGVHVTLSHFCPTAAALLFDAEGPPRIVSGPPVRANGEAPEGLDATDALPPAESDTRLLSWDAVAAWESALVTRLYDDEAAVEPRADVFDRARSATLSGWTWPEAPADLAGGWRALVARAWPHWGRVVGRYLASKVHASWAMHLGEGPAEVERFVGLARTVLQVEAVRQCQRRQRALDRPTLTEAIRQADLLLVHLADPQRLYRPASVSR